MHNVLTQINPAQLFNSNSPGCGAYSSVALIISNGFSETYLMFKQSDLHKVFKVYLGATLILVQRFYGYGVNLGKYGYCKYAEYSISYIEPNQYYEQCLRHLFFPKDVFLILYFQYDTQYYIYNNYTHKMCANVLKADFFHHNIVSIYILNIYLYYKYITMLQEKNI